MKSYIVKSVVAAVAGLLLGVSSSWAISFGDIKYTIQDIFNRTVPHVDHVHVAEAVPIVRVLVVNNTDLPVEVKIEGSIINSNTGINEGRAIEKKEVEPGEAEIVALDIEDENLELLASIERANVKFLDDGDLVEERNLLNDGVIQNNGIVFGVTHGEHIDDIQMNILNTNPNELQVNIDTVGKVKNVSEDL